MSDDLVVIGRLNRPHGIRGALRARPSGPNLVRLAVGERVDATRDGTTIRTLTLASRGGTGDALILTFEGVTDRTSAEALAGAELAIPRARLIPTEPDTFYVRSLIGCAVVSGSTTLGVVIEVTPGPANDILVVHPEGGGEALLLPFTEDGVPEVDLEGRRLVVRAGLIDPEEIR